MRTYENFLSIKKSDYAVQTGTTVLDVRFNLKTIVDTRVTRYNSVGNSQQFEL